MLLDKTTLGEISIDNKGYYGIAASAVDYSEELYTYLRITDITNDGRIDYTNLKSVNDANAGNYLLKPNDIVFARTGGSTGRNYFYDGSERKFVYAGFLIKFSLDDRKVNPRFIKYYCQSSKYKNWITSYNTGSTRGNINAQTYANMEIELPPRYYQDRIVLLLDTIENKLLLNNAINNNLEQQAQAIFLELFKNKIDNVEFNNNKQLKELVQNVDNRGKTPPCTTVKTLYPIIDVRALSGNTRIIDYNKCTKYVEKDTYDNWFRNGHPQKYDILLSTVGSLAEMKLFMGQIGCIAQNVVGYRCNISPLYLYQYLNFIKKDLLAYDIGSVQPSIKVTHIAKHPIYIPSKNELEKFHSISEAITNKIYNNCKENEYLTQLRDTLLPKLMSGEIDVSEVDISTDKLLFS